MNRLQVLDYGRFLAAVFVMSFHYFFNGINNGKVTALEPFSAISDIAKYGYLGVEFFFIISGYVIGYSYSGKTAGQFTLSRTVRLLPAFWAGIIFTSTMSFLIGTNGTEVTLAQFFANFMLVPQIFGFGFVDGVYWTLVYEVAFYSLLIFAMILGLTRHISGFFLIWPWLIAICSFTPLRDVPYLGGYFAFFAAGAVFAHMRSWRAIVAIPTAFVAIYNIVDFAISHGLDLAIERNTYYSPSVIFLVIITMAAFFLSLNINAVREIKLPFSVQIGSLTYPLYLIHAHFGYMMLNQIGQEAGKYLIALLVMALSICLALLLHILVERRMKSFWLEVFAIIFENPVDQLTGAIGTIMARLRRQTTGSDAAI